MSRLKIISNAIRRSKVLKYALVITVAVVLVGFVGDNSVWSHIRNKQKIADLQNEIQRYQQQYEHDMRQLRRFDTDPHAVEEIARERYFMKADDEDIFVLSDDESNQQTEEDERTE